MPKSKAKLPKEALVFAKSMGISLEGLEPEAEEIWKMLDDLSTRNQTEYESFVAQQLKEAKESEGQSSDNRPSFRPTVGFSVLTYTKSGDGIKIRDLSNSSRNGKKLFVNICSHPAVDIPVDEYGTTLSNEHFVTDGVSIPLAVGPLRDADEDSLAVDVVVHTIVVELTSTRPAFLKQVVDLTLHWVQQECEIECDPEWTKCANSAYAGGRGENKDIPVLFFVEKEAGKGKQDGGKHAGTGNPEGVISSTSSLLSEIHKEKDTVEPVQLLNDEHKCEKVDRAPLIQEIGAPQASPLLEDTIHVTQAKVATSPPEVMPASVEVAKPAPSKKEYLDMERLMEQFDDEFSNTLPKDDESVMATDAAMTLISDLAKAMAGPPSLSGATTTPGQLSPKQNKSEPRVPTSDPATTERVPNKAPKNIEPPIEKCLQVFNAAPQLLKACFKNEIAAEDPAGTQGTVILTISGLLSTLDTANMDLMVAETEVRLCVCRQYISDAGDGTGAGGLDKVPVGLKLTDSSRKFRAASTSAAFKKKKGTLTIRIGYNTPSYK